VILSIARPHKYMTMDNQNFAAIHTPVLEKYKKAILLVVGPDESDEWKIENKKTNGRVLAFGKREDTAIFYEAADIYVDSYPINSITSLLEAGCYGLPLISRCPYPEESAVLCADAPGLTNRLIITRNLQEYHSRLSHLIENEKYRLDLGEETRQSISSLHGGALWNQSLNALYHQASNTPPLEWAIAKHDESLVDGLDFSLSQLQKDEPGLDDILKFHLRILPLDLRMRGWVDVVQKKHTFLPGLLLPEWIGSRFERWLQA